MSQKDFTIDNGTGAAVRVDIQESFQALATNSSGGSAPATNYASQFFANTSTSIMQINNTSGNAFINLFTLAGGPAFAVDGTINSINIGKGTNSVAHNTVLGQTALDAAVTGNNNTAIGHATLSANTSGEANTCCGSFGGTVISSGARNTAMGTFALGALTTGDENTACGANSLGLLETGSRNTAVGESALNATTGSDNTAVGHDALKINTSGTDNVAVGSGALDGNQTGSNNTAVGQDSLGGNTEGANNVSVGKDALKINTAGSSGVAIGYRTLDANTTGSNNVAIGGDCLGVSETGSDNTAMGSAAGASVFSGGNNLILGHDAGRSGSPSGEITTASNQICLGDNSITNAFIKVAFTVTSDERDKIEDGVVSHGLDFVNQLKPKSFWFRKNRDSDEKTGDKRYGFYAHDILALEGSNSVIIDSKDADNLKFKGDQLIPVLVNAIKELSAKVTALEAG